MAEKIQEQHFATWGDLIDEFDTMRSWIFRGHASANWSLESTLDRHTPSGYPKPAAEFNLSYGFQRRAHTYLQTNEIPTTPGEWLALMQHYGAPTRLLDFTHSPYVAAYFAVEQLPTDGCPNFAIWAIEPGWCLTQFGFVVWKGGDIFGFDRTVLQAGMEGATKDIPAAIKGDPAREQGYRYFMLGSVVAGLIDKYAQHSAPPMAAVFEPTRLSARLAAQQGVFVWPGDVSVSVMANLIALGEQGGPRKVRKLTFPTRERGRALDHLRLMNITRTSLFPGLEGFAQSFRQELIRESPADTSQRMLIRTLARTSGGPTSES